MPRALVGRPDLVFADEPTGNLDSNSSAEVLGFLRHSVDDFGQTIAMVTHDPRGAAHADRVVFLADGAVVADLVAPTADADPRADEGAERLTCGGPRSRASSPTSSASA